MQTTQPPVHKLLPIVLLFQILSARFLAEAYNSQSPSISKRFDSISFEQGYSIIWGQPNISEDGSEVQLKLDSHSGSGFISQDNYLHGFFSASIKLPAAASTAGVVLAFYTSNGDAYPENHDELDFEFLGNIPGKGWRVQTNVYGNGSVSRGREERFDFWFDPTADFHDYSILWNDKHIVFMVDNIPIRELTKTDALGADYPSKPMALYATIWDGSGWATDGGKYPVDYKLAPFVATFANLKLEGCAADPVGKQADQCQSVEDVNPAKASDLLALNSDQKAALEWVRVNHLYYSYCDDKSRYPVPLPECSSGSSSGSNRKGKRHKSHSRRSSRSSRSAKRGRTLIENTGFASTDQNEAQTLLASHPRFSSIIEVIDSSLPTSMRVPYTRSRRIPKTTSVSEQNIAGLSKQLLDSAYPLLRNKPGILITPTSSIFYRQTTRYYTALEMTSKIALTTTGRQIS